VSQDVNSHTVNIQWSAANGSTDFQLMLDDTSSFRTPIVTLSTRQNGISLNMLDAGLSPGTTYYVRLQPYGIQTSFVAAAASWPETYLSYAYAKQAWQVTGRQWVGYYSGVNWNASQQEWVLDSSWGDANTMVAQDAYYNEYPLRAAVQMGSIRQDVELLDEVARFYVAFEPRFTTLGKMRSLPGNTAGLEGEGADSIRTLIWVVAGQPQQVLDCPLCNAQFLHPAAHLLRAISALPAAQRTAGMQAFAQWYGPLLVNDHLMNLLYEAPNHERVGQLQRWYADPQQPFKITDTDLWLIATAAEIVGGHANDPSLVPLTGEQQARLLQAIALGIAGFQSNQTLYADTENFAGEVVGSVSYFNGEFVDEAEYAYSGYTGARFPSAADAKVDPETSWDVGHFYRVPVMLRSLYDNRKATGVSFPQARDIELLVNQLMYRVFQGNFQKPLLNNYFNGGNGWFRVGYSGSSFGYPPAQYCNAASYKPMYQVPCLISSSVQGWGLLALYSPDLMRLEHSLLTLAASTDPEQIAFRNQYFIYCTTYSFTDATGQPQYPPLVLWLLGGAAEKLQ
jgi:hypothetical protein